MKLKTTVKSKCIKTTYAGSNISCIKVRP